jgi:hypothetical protein
MRTWFQVVKTSNCITIALIDIVEQWFELGRRLLFEYSSISCDNESRTISRGGRKQKIKRESTEPSGTVATVAKRISFEK